MDAFIVGLVICGGITAAIAQAKNLRPVWSWFVAGALLGIIGIIIVLCTKSGLPEAPSGMRAVRCPRCNTVQNVPDAQPILQCWQCGAAYELWVPGQVEPFDPIPVTSADSADKPKNTGFPQPKKLRSMGPRSRVRCHRCQHAQMVAAGQTTFVCAECGATTGC
ncbi:hypothetical protein [Mycobacterium marinum]|uniref:hypothetical protein n=1 Tax=Mycobacterium marinum TaxID=1781 RepID=UPI002359F12F|nr:hypothetical protein [Mycobacterium marinum]MDC8981253.1 hypothetical protein [Mycobacterium marinum]